MRIKYTLPAAENMEIVVDSPLADNRPTACEYIPEPLAGLRYIPVGKFKAVGNNGRVEEAVVQFDVRKGEFVIQPKKLVAAGFDFDKPPEVPAAEQPAEPKAVDEIIQTSPFPPSVRTPAVKK